MLRALHRSIPYLGTLLLVALTSMRPACSFAANAAAALMPPDSTLTLDWLERTALIRNASLSAMRAAVREARARASEAGALEDPMLDGMVAPQSLGAGSSAPAYRLGITQRFPLFGQRGLRRRAAEAESEAAASDFEAARLDLLRDVRASYFDYFRVYRAQEIQRERIELMSQSRRVALAKYAAGTVQQTDPLAAETELAMLQHEAVELDQRRSVVLSRLRALLHLSPSVRLPEPPRDLPLPEPLDTGEWMSGRTAPPWPELAAATATLRAREAELTLAHRERLPEFGLSAAYDRFWSEPDLRTSVGASLSLPLNLGRLAARRREAQAAVSKAEAERDAARDRLEQRVEEASASLALDLHDVEIVRDVVLPASERSLKATRAGYEANRSDFIALLSATRDHAKARLELYDAEATALDAHAELMRALATDAASPVREDQP